MTLSLSVVIITFKRPEFLRRCLRSLAALDVQPAEVLVVDQSPDDESRVVAIAEGERWLDNRANAGNMTSSRNVGLSAATGDVVAFIDDDVEVGPGWGQALLDLFAQRSDVGGATGLTLNDGQLHTECAEVGSISATGRLIGHFECTQVQARQDVQHLLGANMAFRRAILLDLGGFDEEWPGTSMAEDSDIALRVRRAGWSLVFDPAAQVVHFGAPHVVGARFDLRYHYFARRNYTRLLLRHQELLRLGPVAYLRAALQEDLASERRPTSRAARLVTTVAAVIVGAAAATRRGEARGAALRRTVRTRRTSR